MTHRITLTTALTYPKSTPFQKQNIEKMSDFSIFCFFMQKKHKLQCKKFQKDLYKCDDL